MALIGLMLNWLRLIGCQILNNLQRRRTKKKIKHQCQSFVCHNYTSIITQTIYQL